MILFNKGVLDLKEKEPMNAIVPMDFDFNRLKQSLVFKRQMLMYTDALQVGQTSI